MISFRQYFSKGTLTFATFNFRPTYNLEAFFTNTLSHAADAAISDGMAGLHVRMHNDDVIIIS